MKAFVLAAGLGTRLKPWTEHHPKALVPVGGVPMLERVIVSLREQGFDFIVVNVHHFANQIVDFLSSKEFGVRVDISDESKQLLDTGGAILHAAPLLCRDERPFLIHNVDILSNANLQDLMDEAEKNGNALDTLLISNRDSSRKLLFDTEMHLQAWHNLSTDEYRPSPPANLLHLCEYAFSGIHAMSPKAVDQMSDLGYEGKFPVMDFLLNPGAIDNIRGYLSEELQLIDIGKPETLSRANNLFRK